MYKNPLIRLAAILVGAGVLFGLQQGLGLALYFAIPIAIVAYTACRFGLGALMPEQPAD
jgi:hypothetical protein